MQNNGHFLVPELTVSDFDKSLFFYQEVLNFSLKYKRKNPSFAYLYYEKMDLMIEEMHGQGWYVGELSYPYGRGINLQMSVSDVFNLWEHVQRFQVKIFQNLQKVSYDIGKKKLTQIEFLIQDPDGYLLRFCQIE